MIYLLHGTVVSGENSIKKREVKEMVGSGLSKPNEKHAIPDLNVRLDIIES
jgi:hypothetical protein